MRCYGDDRNHSSLRAIIPKDPVCAGRFLLGICLEDLFPVRPFEGSKFVRIQRGMSQVGFKKPKAFPDGFEDIPLRGVVFNFPKVGVGLGRENQFVHQSLFGILGKRSALNRSLLRKPSEDFLEGVPVFEKPGLLDRNLHHGFEYNSRTIRVGSNGTDVSGREKFG
jgi:hypothetical protein